MADIQATEHQEVKRRKTRKYAVIAAAAAAVVGIFVLANLLSGDEDEVEVTAVTSPVTSIAVGSTVPGASTTPGGSTTPGATTIAVAATSSTRPASTTSTSSTTSTTFAPATTGKSQSVEPLITIPDTPAPTALGVKDLVPGTGRAVQNGDRIVVNYKGVAWNTRIGFDSTFVDGREPFVIQVIGAGGVIPGWEQGLLGMKVGGRRQLVIPPDLGYGAAGSPPRIGSNEPLVFIVDLLAANPSGVVPTSAPPAPAVATLTAPPSTGVPVTAAGTPTTAAPGAAASATTTSATTVPAA